MPDDALHLVWRPDGIAVVPSLRVENRGGRTEIFLHGDIEPGSAQVYARELKAAGNRPVLVRIHSGGGHWSEAAAMYAATQAHPARTTALVEGLAASSASFLLQAFNERRISENGLVMVHSPVMDASGRAEDHEAAAAVLKTVRARLAVAYGRSGQPAAVVDGWLAGESWFDATEALAAGLVDAIDRPVAIAARLDLSQFTNVPQRILAAMGCRPPAQTSSLETPMDATNERPEDTAPVIAASAAPTLAAVRAAYRSAASLGLENAIVDQLMDDGCAAENVPEQLIEIHARKAQTRSSAQRVMPSGLQVVRDVGETLARRIVDALHARIVGKDPPEHARELRGKRLDELRAMVASRPRAASGWTWAGDIQATGGLHGTSDFDSLLAAGANKALLEFYTVAQTPMFQVARRNDAPDFKTRHRVRLGEAPALLEVIEGGEVTSGTAGEADEVIQLATFGRIWGLTRQAVINDDLGAFSDQLRWWGNAAASLEATKLVAALAGVMSDTKPLFDATHGNLAASGTAITTAALSAGRVAMRTQKGVGGVEIVGAPPRFLLTGPVKETEAQQILASIYASTATAVNTFSGVLSLLVEPRLAGNVWYLFADPQQLPTIECAYLSRAPGPQLEVREGFEILGSEFRLVLDFTAAPVDWRGGYKNPGA